MLYVDLMPILLYFHISHIPSRKSPNLNYIQVEMTLKVNPEITLYILANCISLLNKLSDEKTYSEYNYNKQNFNQYMSVALSCFFH